MTFNDLAVGMLKCEQTKGQSVYQHGMSVKEHYDELLAGTGTWRIPEWFSKHHKEILANQHDKEIVSSYLVYHDCGKPFCREVDAEGKVHFPNHAEVSKRVFLEAGGDPIAANLIGWDMVLHSCNADEIQHLLDNEWTAQDACTLLCASLAEVHSNAKMFGGLESISFKSKWKTLERRGKQICKHFFKETANV
jgi:hypothetical protein